MDTAVSPPPAGGILLLDKPAQKTSFYLVGLLRRVTKIKKIGHCGTLDPFATGVMVMLVGKQYTRRSDEFLGMEKEYVATLKLGASTTTYDLEGDVTATSDRVPSLGEVEDAIAMFQGTIEQVPPMFSAKKVAGKKLYELARQGIEIERKAARVELTTTLVDYSYPEVKIAVTCSKGTYIRSVADDLGKALGTYAHLTELRRTRSGPFTIDQCLSASDVLSPDFSLEASAYRDVEEGILLSLNS